MLFVLKPLQFQAEHSIECGDEVTGIYAQTVTALIVLKAKSRRLYIAFVLVQSAWQKVASQSVLNNLNS